MKNFLLTIVRFKMATTLNVVGLAVAFAAFTVIMMQVTWEYSYGTTDKAADSIFRFENHNDAFNYYDTDVDEFVVNDLLQSSSEIVGHAFISFNKALVSVEQDGQKEFFNDISVMFLKSDPTNLFDIEMEQGVISDMLVSNMAIVSRSTANLLFGDKDPIGKQFECWGDLKTVCGVYKELPDNATIPNGAIIYDGEIDCATLFVKLSDPSKTGKVIEHFKKINKEVSGPGYSYIPSKMQVRLNNVGDIYFSEDVFDRQGNRTTTNILFLIAIFLIMIAMINFINFYMALAPSRIKGLNTRLVFGSTRSTLRRRIVAEGVVIAAAGFLVGLIFIDMFNLTPLRDLIKISSTEISTHWGLITVCALIAVGFGALAGLLPSRYCTSFEPALALKGNAVGAKSGKSLRAALVGVQFVISTALIICALFVTLQHKTMLNAPLGFDKSNLLVAKMGKNTLAKQLQEEIKNMPFVKSSAKFSGSFGIKDADMHQMITSNDGENSSISCFFVDPQFLSLIGIPIVEGEGFPENEENMPEQTSSEQTIIINKTAAKMFQIKLGDVLSGYKVVGITDNFVSRSIALEQLSVAFMVENDNRSLLIRIDAENTQNSIDKINAAIKKIIPENTPTVSFYHEHIEQLYGKEKDFGILITMFSVLAIILSLIGVFGLVFFDTQSRRKEIGLRKVFGATVKEVLMMFNVRYIKILLICFAIAIPIGYIIMWKWLEGFVYKTPLAVWVGIVAVAMVLIMTVVIVTLQTVRTANENPVKSIKTE